MFTRENVNDFYANDGFLKVRRAIFLIRKLSGRIYFLDRNIIVMATFFL